MFRKSALLVLIAFILVLSLAGCMPGQKRDTAPKPSGFFWGVWHGWIAPISLIFGFFNPEISIYDSHNTGWWYDLGFYIAIIGGFGGVSIIRKTGKKK